MPRTHLSLALQRLRGGSVTPCVTDLLVARSAGETTSQAPRQIHKTNAAYVPQRKKPPPPPSSPGDQAAALAAKRGDALPLEILCPISLCVMRDPVVAGDGRTYERTAITEWLSRRRSPPPPFLLLPSPCLLLSSSLLPPTLLVLSSLSFLSSSHLLISFSNPFPREGGGRW